MNLSLSFEYCHVLIQYEYCSSLRTKNPIRFSYKVSVILVSTAGHRHLTKQRSVVSSYCKTYDDSGIAVGILFRLRNRYIVKKVSYFPVPSRHVTKKTLPGGD